MRPPDYSSDEPAGIGADPTSNRRSFFASIAVAALKVALPAPRAEAAERETEKRITLDALPHGPEDIYLLLFENNPDDERTDDDFIADVEAAAGYDAPFQWHVEIMYFNPQQNQWMVMGCRPPSCSLDYPAKDLLNHHRGDTIRVNRLKVPVAQQLEAREFFIQKFQGQVYALAGPAKTNCSDVPAALSSKLEIGNLKTFTRAQLTGMQALRGVLSRHGYTLEQILKRDDLVFPDAVESMGQRLGILSL